MGQADISENSFPDFLSQTSSVSFVSDIPNELDDEILFNHAANEDYNTNKVK